jgi:hypothetical protein
MQIDDQWPLPLARVIGELLRKVGLKYIAKETWP